MDWTRLAQQVRAMRMARGWTQEELAEEAGLSGQMISAIERAERKNVNVTTIAAIARALGANMLCEVRPDGLEIRVAPLVAAAARLSPVDLERVVRFAQAAATADDEAKEMAVRIAERASKASGARSA